MAYSRLLEGLLHGLGRLNSEEQTYIPASEQRKVFFKARIYLLIYAAVAGTAIFSGSILPLMFIGLPNL